MLRTDSRKETEVKVGIKEGERVEEMDADEPGRE